MGVPITELRLELLTLMVMILLALIDWVSTDRVIMETGLIMMDMIYSGMLCSLKLFANE